MKNSIMLSVVIATYNRSELLLQLIERLLEQSLDESDYEIIVVDDGSTDGTAKKINTYYKKNGNIKCISQPNRGPGKARNRGMFEARGDIVAFTDDDCLPDTNWLEVIKDKFSENNYIIGLEGYTYTTKEDMTPLTHQIKNIRGGISYPTCNMAYLTKQLKKEGGFDEMFPNAHNEDVDLAWRMMKYGPIVFCKEMRVFHPPRPEKLINFIKRIKIFGSDYYLYYKHNIPYRQTRAINPWVNLYFKFPLFFRLPSTLHWLRYWKKPWLFFQAFMKFFAQMLYLIYLIPYFRKLEIKFNDMKKNVNRSDWHRICN